mmetsp:Transcript_95889/g.240345  ORF Transcript_95889/g.240345 Transcript_95889/m.240345 type:complete len:186 (-) Transcript_95889:347-904(-)
MISVHTPFMKSSECEVSTIVVGYCAKYSSSQTHAPKSKWFVGSSSKSNVGLLKRACASATRMRQPPDMSFVALCIIASVKPRPCSKLPASGSKVSGAMRSNLSPSISRMSALASGSSSHNFWTSPSSLSYSFCATSMTDCKAEMSVGSASRCTCQISMWSGIGNSLAARQARSVDLPLPLEPMSP